MQLYYIYAACAVLVALGYMLFDVLNRREVPNLFAYSTLAFAFAIILLSGSWALITESYLIAFAILGLGYFVYKMGQLGLGDAFEFAALSLLLAPVAAPLIPYALSGPTLPSVVSLFLDTGIAAIVVIPIFYVVVALRKQGSRIFERIGKGEKIRALAVAASYLVVALLLLQISYAKTVLLPLLLLVVLGSVLLILFQGPITETMVENVGVSGFVEDDIIAFNLMSPGKIASAKRKVKSFDRLVTGEMISEMKKKRIRDRFPVYKRAVPFAVPIFLGTLITIIAGNLLLIALLG
jgi:Flp pilus assembly protein protease CpaA